MGAFLKRKHGIGLIVCLAILLQLCAPLRALASDVPQLSPWTAEICRSNAPKAPASTPGHSLQHCLFCASAGDQPAMPVSSASLRDLPPAAVSYPLVTLVAAPPAPRYLAAQPRAPPNLS